MFFTFPICDLAVENGPKNAKSLSKRVKGMSTCFCQMAIFSLAIGGSGAKFLPSLPSDVGIMKAKGFFSVSSLEDEVVSSIVEFEKLVAEGFSMCKMLKQG